MSIYEKLEKEDVLFCDRSGNIVSIYCKDDIKIIFTFKSVEQAKKKYTKFRKEFEGIKLGD